MMLKYKRLLSFGAGLLILSIPITIFCYVLGPLVIGVISLFFFLLFCLIVGSHLIGESTRKE